jgi:uncharacterized protein YbjT (DUF2867 family)
MTATTNLRAAEQEAGVKHQVALSVLGAQIMPHSGYNTAKSVQENLIKASGLALFDRASNSVLRIRDWIDANSSSHI